MKVKKNNFILIRMILSALLIFSVLINSVQIDAKEKTVIVLDPGHGDNYNYHVFELDGYSFAEYELNWKIAVYLRDILKNYPEIDVRLTKSDAYEHPSLKDRVEFVAKIKKNKGVYLISLHNNARPDGVADITDEGPSGCMVLATNKNYKSKVGKKIDKLAHLIIKELSALGLNVNYPKTNGIWRRSSKKTKYPNGKKADYYGLIQRGIYQNVPTIIVEHAHMTDINDVNEYLTNDEDLHSLAVADAKAIVKFLGLTWQEECAKYPGEVEEGF